MGRIPGFVRKDEGCATSAMPRSTATARLQSRAALDKDAEQYKARYDHALQYFQMRCQHHMHPSRRVKRKVASGREFARRPQDEDTESIRIIPNACQAKGGAKECKHGAPWTSIINMGMDARLLLVCPGIAKHQNLWRNGARHTVGSALPLRNYEWLNGTIAGFCIAFAGSNTDVQPNGLLPMLPISCLPESVHE